MPSKIYFQISEFASKVLTIAKRPLNMIKERYSKENKRYRNRIEFLEMSTYEEIRKSERQELKKNLIFSFKFTFVPFMIVFSIIGIRICSEYFKYGKFKIPLSNETAEVLRTYFIENKAEVYFQTFYRIFKFFGPTALLIISCTILLIALIFKIEDFLFEYYVNRNILITEKLRKYYAIISAKVDYQTKSPTLLIILIFAGALIMGFVYFEPLYGEYAFPTFSSPLLIYLSYLNVRAIRETNLGLSFLKKFQKAKFIELMLSMSLLLFVVYCIFLIFAHGMSMAANLWRKDLIDLNLSWIRESVNKEIFEIEKAEIFEKIGTSWPEFTFEQEFSRIAKIIFPYLLVFMIFMVLFFHIIPLLIFDRTARKKYLVLFLSFFAGNVAVFVIDRVVPMIFYLEKSSMIFILIIMFIGYIGAKVLESEIEELVLEKKCKYCGENNLMEAEYCIFCGKKF